LDLPAVEVSTVVRDCQFEMAHARRRTLDLSSIAGAS
jgi:hypothetical protein